ncbi:MAG: type II and III secretion system protein family protein [Sulfuricella sp.]|nr:type II and III secretion system protein family protein [Sulfuricella sp.]
MKNKISHGFSQLCSGALALAIGAVLGMAAPQLAFSASKPQPSVAAPQHSEEAPAAAMTQIGPHIGATLGKSTLIRLPSPVARMSVGNPAVADVVLINPREVYVLGKSIGSTNIILWNKDGQATIVDVTVAMDTAALQDKLHQLLPNEKNIKVSASADSVVLSGRVSDSVKASQAVELANAYTTALMASSGGAAGGINNGGGAVGKTVNLLQLNDPQQVMLEVKVAEISKTLLDKLGVKFSNGHVTSGGWTYTLLSDFLFGNLGGNLLYSKGLNSFQLDAQRENGLIRVLAEPTIMAISGQKGSFLAGGKVFIPVSRTDQSGLPVITLEEKEFGVGLVFTPTVLEGGRINLNVAPEVSDLNQNGSPFVSANGITSILPSFSVRRAATTVQLNDGQSFAIAGLIKSNASETIKAFPVLGEIPILGALFRSSEFQNDKTELLFIITPRLVKPLPPDYKLPTDNFAEPTRAEFFLGGKMEGKPNEPSPAGPTAKPQTGAAGGFEMK